MPQTRETAIGTQQQDSTQTLPAQWNLQACIDYAFAAKHHDTQEPSQRRERRSGRKDRQSSPLPQPHGIRKPTYRKPATARPIR